MSQPIFFRQDALLEHVEQTNDRFLFAIDRECDQGTRTGKAYSSCPDSKYFLDRYQKLPQEEQVLNELIRPPHFEFYDLDLTFSPDQYDPAKFNDLSLFNWFHYIRDEFVNHMIKPLRNSEIGEDGDLNRDGFLRQRLAFLSRPDWVVLTASGKVPKGFKLSLHLINRNCVFTSNDTFKSWYKSFESYIENTVSKTDPYVKSFDTLVCSLNRTMRIIGSVKLDDIIHKRPLRPLKLEKLFCYSELISPIHTFITDPINDPDFEKKNDPIKGWKVPSTFRFKYGIFFPEYSSQMFMHSKSKHISFNLPIDDQETSEQNKEGNLSETKSHKIVELLDMLSDKRSDERKYWLRVGMSLKALDVSYEIFETFSKRSSKFDMINCRETWDSLVPKQSAEFPISWASLYTLAKTDSPDKYKEFIVKYRKTRVKLLFTPDRTIKEQYVPSDIYKWFYSNADILGLKSCMNTGKTHGMPVLFEEPSTVRNGELSCLVVSFRVSLTKEISVKWKSKGFDHYSEIEGPIDIDMHRKVIVQLDSLPRIIGRVDLLILDEIESIHTHLCSSQYINRQLCFNALMCYIRNTPKIIFADANLSDQTVQLFLSSRNSHNKVVKVLNEYPSFSHIKAKLCYSKNYLIHVIKQFIKEGKRVIVPSNTKKFIKELAQLLIEEFPDIKLLAIHSDSPYVNISEWNQYDVILHTPTIVAGISFEIKHFHACCAYFIGRSCNAEMASQMLFRSRHLIDQQLIVCVPINAQEAFLPLNQEGLDEAIQNRILQGHRFMTDYGLNIDNYNKKIIKDQYYKLFREYTRKQNLSELYFDSYLREIFTFHGIQVETIRVKDNPNGYTLEIKEQLTEMIKMASLEVCKQDAQDIISAPMFCQQYVDSLIKSHEELSISEKRGITRFMLLNTFGKKYDDPLNTPTSEEGLQWVKTNLKYIDAYANYKLIKSKRFVNGIQFLQKRFESEYLLQLAANQDTYDTLKQDYRVYMEDQHSTTSASESEADVYKGVGAHTMRRERHRLQKKNVKQSSVNDIHYNNRWKKMEICLSILHSAGFEGFIDTEKIKPDWNSIHRYCTEHEKEIRGVFGCKKMNWSETLDKNEKVSLSMYINHKLDTVLGCRITKPYDKATTYILSTLFKE